MSEFDHSAGDKISKTFCILPWIHRFTNIGGEIQVCCVSEEFDNNVKTTFGRKLNLSDSHSDEEIMNSSFMKNIRLQMMKGKWPEFCQRCIESEKGGGTSRRIAENNRFRFEIDDTLENTNLDGSLKTVKVRFADFRLGNLCNLACRMCNPRASSKWIKEWNQIEHNWFAVSESKLKEFSKYDWYKKSEIWDNFREQVPYLEHLHFAGGEPLLIPQMAELLQTCVDEGRSKDIALSYNTNLTILSPKVKELWGHFKEVRIFASIDGIGDLNDYIRYPSKWSDTEKLLLELDEIFEQVNLKELTFATTVQAYNVLNIDQLIDYTLQFKNITPFPNLINLYNPEHYRTQVLPRYLKEIASEKLESSRDKGLSYLEKNPEKQTWKFVLDSINDAIFFMNDADLSQMYKSRLRQTIDSKDKSRNQSIKEVCPELSQWLNQN